MDLKGCLNQNVVKQKQMMAFLDAIASREPGLLVTKSVTLFKIDEYFDYFEGQLKDY